MFVGSKEVKSIHVGGQAIQAVYVGSTLVWPAWRFMETFAGAVSSRWSDSSGMEGVNGRYIRAKGTSPRSAIIWTIPQAVNGDNFDVEVTVGLFNSNSSAPQSSVYVGSQSGDQIFVDFDRNKGKMGYLRSGTWVTDKTFTFPSTLKDGTVIRIVRYENTTTLFIDQVAVSSMNSGSVARFGDKAQVGLLCRIATISGGPVYSPAYISVKSK